MSTTHEEERLWLIPDKSLTTNIRGIFGSGNSLLFFASGVNGKSVRDSRSLSSDVLLHETKFSTTLYSPFARKLVNESRGIFMASKKLSSEQHDSAVNQNILKISQKYRSVLLACVEDLGNAIEETTDQEKVDNYVVERNLFYSIELIWNLIEILWIDTQSSFGVLIHLLEWIQRHFTDADKKFQEIINTDEFHLNPKYWEAIFQYVLQGKISTARLALKNHPDFAREDFCSIDELLRKMPVYLAKSGVSITEFRLRWQHWQEECKRRLHRAEFSSEPKLKMICGILCGDDNIFNELSDLCESWYHVLISKLLYKDPSVAIHELGTFARACFNSYGPENNQSQLDTIILAVLELDILKVIKEACFFQDGWWLAAHLTDLLYCAGHINMETLSFPVCLHEVLLKNYADSLMCHPSLWQVGVDYLDQCEEQKEYLELYLERIPLDSEIKGKKVYTLAKERNLEKLAKSICKVMAVTAIKNGMLGTALKWVVESKDARFASSLTSKLIAEYSETGKFNCFEILSNLGFQMLISDQLTFVGKYCEFHKLYREKEFRNAATLLVSLLSSGLVPKQFHLVMLLDALPLLEPEAVFTTQETYQLMACLEGLDLTSDSKDQPGASKKEALLRLALARNLARAFIQEETDFQAP